MILRQYQIQAINSIYDTIRQGKNALCYMGCGSGKTVIFTHIVRDAISKNRKVLVIVNKIILIENTLKTFKRLGLDATVYYGKKKEISNLMVGTIFSLKKIKDKEFDLIIWDECHRYDFGSESIKNLMLRLNNTFSLAFSGTPWREGEYVYGEDKFWTLSFSKGLKELTEEKYLVPIIYQSQAKDSIIDYSHVRRDKEDYVLSALQEEILNHEDKIKLQVEDALKKSIDRKKIIVITTGISHAEIVLSLLDNSATILHSKLSNIEQDNNLKDFNEGRKRILVSVLIASEGYDNKEIDCIWMFRPTRSPTLYIQCVGRGLRICEGKANLLMLDYGGIIDELGDIYNVKIKKDKKQKSNFKLQCPVCDRVYFSPKSECECGKHIFTRECLYCGNTIKMTHSCLCNGGIESRTKKLTIEAYTNQTIVRIDNPVMQFCMHQGPKQEVFLVKISKGVFDRKQYYFHIPRFKMVRIQEHMDSDIKDITLDQVKQLFTSKIKYIVLEKDGKYFTPTLIGMENKTFALH